jgi:hypothetical protein
MDKDFALDPVQATAVLQAFADTYLGHVLQARLRPEGNILNFTVPCADSGRLVTLGHVGSGDAFDRPPIDTAQKLRATILSFVDHELRELLKLGGKPLFNPHDLPMFDRCLTGDNRAYIEKGRLL